MDFFSRNTPVYKRRNVSTTAPVAHARPATPSGLSGLMGSLLGSATPAYKTADGHGAKAPAPSGFWSMFAVAPSYKTAQPQICAEGSEALDVGELDIEEACACAPGPDEIVLL